VKITFRKKHTQRNRHVFIWADCQTAKVKGEGHQHTTSFLALMITNIDR